MTMFYYWIWMSVTEYWMPYLYFCIRCFFCELLNWLFASKKNPTWTDLLLQMTDGDGHLLWSKACIGRCLENARMSVLNSVPYGMSSSASLFSLSINAAPNLMSALLQGTLRSFDSQWPLILSCRTWCRYPLEYRVKRYIMQESVFISISCCCNEAHSHWARSKNY